MQPCPRPGGSRPWLEVELVALGKAPDGVLAKRFGRSTEAVRHKRTRRGVPAFDSTWVLWTAEQDAMIGRLSTAEVAARSGRTASAIRARRRWLKRRRQLAK